MPRESIVSRAWIHHVPNDYLDKVMDFYRQERIQISVLSDKNGITALHCVEFREK